MQPVYATCSAATLEPLSTGIACLCHMQLHLEPSATCLYVPHAVQLHLEPYMWRRALDVGCRLYPATCGGEALGTHRLPILEAAASKTAALALGTHRLPVSEAAAYSAATSGALRHM